MMVFFSASLAYSQLAISPNVRKQPLQNPLVSSMAQMEMQGEAMAINEQSARPDGHRF